jgi:hypothetical protein
MASGQREFPCLLTGVSESQSSSVDDGQVKKTDSGSQGFYPDRTPPSFPQYQDSVGGFFARLNEKIE